MYNHAEEEKKFAEYVKEKMAGNPYFIALPLIDQALNIIQREAGVSEEQAAEAMSSALSRSIEVKQNLKNLLKDYEKPGSS